MLHTNIMCVCVCVCVCVCIYIYMCVCIYIYVCVCVCVCEGKNFSCFHNMNVPTSYINATKLRKHPTQDLLRIVNCIDKIRPKYKVS